MFASFQEALQKYLQSLVPDNIAKSVMAALTQSAAIQPARQRRPVPQVAMARLMIDRTLNAIWRVRNRGRSRSALVYWPPATLATAGSKREPEPDLRVLSASKRIVLRRRPAARARCSTTIELLPLAAGMARACSTTRSNNTYVLWRHAIAGGGSCRRGFEVAKKLAWPGTSPRCRTLGEVAGPRRLTPPIPLARILPAAVIVLPGAVTAAYAPTAFRRCT